MCVMLFPWQMHCQPARKRFRSIGPTRMWVGHRKGFMPRTTWAFYSLQTLLTPGMQTLDPPKENPGSHKGTSKPFEPQCLFKKPAAHCNVPARDGNLCEPQTNLRHGPCEYFPRTQRRISFAPWQMGKRVINCFCSGRISTSCQT